MHAAMNVRVFVFEVLTAALNHHLRYLGRCSVIEIDERLPVYARFQHGKVFANTLDVPMIVARLRFYWN
jgi:hypothetical protein